MCKRLRRTLRLPDGRIAVSRTLEPVQDDSGAVALLPVDLEAGAWSQFYTSDELTLIVADGPLRAVVEVPRLSLCAVARMQLEVGQLLAPNRLPAKTPLGVLRQVDLAEDIRPALPVVPVALHPVVSVEDSDGLQLDRSPRGQLGRVETERLGVPERNRVVVEVQARVDVALLAHLERGAGAVWHWARGYDGRA